MFNFEKPFLKDVIVNVIAYIRKIIKYFQRTQYQNIDFDSSVRTGVIKINLALMIQ